MKGKFSLRLIKKLLKKMTPEKYKMELIYIKNITPKLLLDSFYQKSCFQKNRYK